MNTTYENTTNINSFLTAFVKGAVEVSKFQDGTDGIQVDTKSTGLCEVRTFVINIPGEEPIHELGGTIMSIKSITAVTILSASLFFAITPSTNTVEKEMTVRGGSTVNQLVVDAAQQEGINLNSVDLNESRDLTIHNTGIDAGNLKPGSVMKVTVVYRK